MQHFSSADRQIPHMGHQHYCSHFTVIAKNGEEKSTTDSGLTPKSSFRAEFVAKSPLAFNPIPTMAEDEGIFIPD